MLISQIFAENHKFEIVQNSLERVYSVPSQQSYSSQGMLKTVIVLVYVGTFHASMSKAIYSSSMCDAILFFCFMHQKFVSDVNGQ